MCMRSMYVCVCYLKLKLGGGGSGGTVGAFEVDCGGFVGLGLLVGSPAKNTLTRFP